MIPNHLFQLLTLTATECPVSFDADAVRDEQAKVLHAIQPLTREAVLTQAVRGQYGRASRLARRSLRTGRGRCEPGLPDGNLCGPSTDDRQLAMGGCPLLFEDGESLTNRVTEIAIQFRRPPSVLFERLGRAVETQRLVLNIQPNEGISLSFQAKVPGGLDEIGDGGHVV